VNFNLTATVAIGTLGAVNNTASVAAPANVLDWAPGNNSASDVTTVNNAPVAQAQSVSLDENTSANGNLTATDAENDTLTYSKVGNPVHGTVSVNANGGFTYTPTQNYSGSDSFTFKANDGKVDSTPATVSVTVRPVNHAPVARAESFATYEDVAISATLSATDPDAGDALTFSKVSDPTHGTAAVDPNGDFRYTPQAHFFGLDYFTFKACDNYTPSACSSDTTITISVTHVNHAPTTANQTVSVAEDGTKTGTLVANDIDSSDTLTFIKVTDPSHGSASVDSATGAFTYTPTPLYHGTDSFTFKANDGHLDSNVATVTFAIDHSNHTPVAEAQSITANNVTPKSGQLIATDVDAGDLLTFTLGANPAHGAVTVHTDGSFIYTADANYLGSDHFTFTACDSSGAANACSAPVSVTITVVRGNHAPVVVGDEYWGEMNSSLSVFAPAGLLANDSDADGDPVTAVLVQGPAEGTLTFNADGSFTYEPLHDATGTVTFTYQVSDGTALSNIATVKINIASVPVPGNVHLYLPLITQ
jgi:VCBS repeat-containing protein